MSWFGIYLRGVLMGAADIVPGVSGGTMAFITGIYDTLLSSIRSFDIALVKLLLRRDIGAAWTHVNGAFLSALLLGIATSVFSLARVLSWVLVNYPVPLWAFFFGLILASAGVLLKQVEQWNASRISALVGGIAIAVGIALAPAIGLDVGLPAIFFSGFLAICAMILPGISGSFILVLLGMYGTVLVAIKSFDIGFLVIFALGAGSGLLIFSRLLYWLLQRFHQATMALLTGFLFGSLAIVWPWKEVLQWTVDSHGEPRAAQQWPVTPAQFQALNGQDPMVLQCLALILIGFGVVWLVDSKLGSSQSA